VVSVRLLGDAPGAISAAGHEVGVGPWMWKAATGSERSSEMSMQEPGRGTERPPVATSGSMGGSGTRGTPGATPRTAPGMGPSTEQSSGGAKEQLSQAVDALTAQAAPVLDQAQDKAGQVFDQALEQATSRLEVQKERLVDGLDAVVHAAQQTGKQLREQGQDNVATYAEKAAHQAERLSGYFREHEVEDLISEAESFARRQPQLFLVGGLTLGLLAARFFKSSARHHNGNGQFNSGAMMARSGAYGGNFSPASSPMSTGYPSTPGAMNRPPSYAGAAPGTSPGMVGSRPGMGNPGSGGMGSGSGQPANPGSAPHQTPGSTVPPAPRPATPGGGLEPGRRA
jgi:hypothetical protein